STRTEGEGTIRWYYTWRLPLQEGTQHELRVRAVDDAGNVGEASEPTLVTVDSIAPQSSIVSPEPGTVFSADPLLVWGLTSDGWGVAQVEVSSAAGRPWHIALLGDDARALLEGVPGVPPADELPESTDIWAVELPIRDLNLAIRSRATDHAGNVEPLSAAVRVSQAPIQIMLPLILQ
ncbi:MAG: hypothetical protein GY759_10030, partial [Chloroflexi bacterium]|nr:hypothetical protein [Chloroflexota bacterium]